MIYYKGWNIPRPLLISMLTIQETKQSINQSIAPQHALDEVAEGTPEVLAAGEAVLVDEEDVLLEARVEVGLEAELADDGVVVAVDVGVDAVHALEDLAHRLREGFREGHADA